MKMVVALPHLFLRRCLAWLPLPDLLIALGTTKIFRYASYGPLILFLHDNNVTTRCKAAVACLQVATDQNSMQDLIASNLIISLMVMLQDGRNDTKTIHGKMLRRCASNVLRRTHEFRPQRGNTTTDPKYEMPIGNVSGQDLTSTAEAELLDECLRISGLSPLPEDVFEEDNDTDDTDDARILAGVPCFNIVVSIQSDAGAM